MDIIVKTNALKDPGSSTIAIANVEFKDSLKVRNITVKEGKNGRFVSMPSYFTNKVNEQGAPIYQEAFNPITAKGRENLYEAVLQSLDSGKEVKIKSESEKSGVSARVVPFEESRNGTVGIGRLCSNCGNEWQTSIVVRKKGHGCPKCNHKEGAKKSIEKKKELGIKTLADVNSAFLKEWDFEKNKGYSLEMFLPNSGKRVWWKCSICGNEWQAKIIDRNKKGTGCPLCANNKSHNTKKVINLDTKEVFESLAEASERSGTSASNICSNLKGKTKKAGGYRWAYYS